MKVMQIFRQAHTDFVNLHDTTNEALRYVRAIDTRRASPQAMEAIRGDLDKAIVGILGVITNLRLNLETIIEAVDGSDETDEPGERS